MITNSGSLLTCIRHPSQVQLAQSGLDTMKMSSKDLGVPMFVFVTRRCTKLGRHVASH